MKKIWVQFCFQCSKFCKLKKNLFSKILKISGHFFCNDFSWPFEYNVIKDAYSSFYFIDCKNIFELYYFENFYSRNRFNFILFQWLFSMAIFPADLTYLSRLFLWIVFFGNSSIWIIFFFKDSFSSESPKKTFSKKFFPAVFSTWFIFWYFS